MFDSVEVVKLSHYCNNNTGRGNKHTQMHQPRPVGIITYDKTVDVTQSKQEEDYYYMDEIAYPLNQTFKPERAS